MTDTDLRLVACQLGDCSNPASLTVTLELPTTWTEEREYTTRTLVVAVCGECARDVEHLGLSLLAARVQFASRLDRIQGKAKLLGQLVGLIEAIGPPYEPVEGGIFARWLADLDRPTAQSAWRLLAHIKRRTLERGAARSTAPAAVQTPSGRGEPAAHRPVPPMERVPFRRPVLVPARKRPGGGDDAA